MTKERPILFSGPMVRAILAGRKTQTRREIKPQPHSKHLGYMAVEGGALLNGPDYPDGDGDFVKCPYGQVGDRLWVRETLYLDDCRYGTTPPRHWPKDDFENIYYRADGECCQQIPECMCAEMGKPKWTPAIHMPRWASRITLEITGVRVERLHEISNADIVAEGFEATGAAKRMPDGTYAVAGRFEGTVSTLRQLFSMKWTEINGKGSWDANPWVWVVEFQRV